MGFSVEESEAAARKHTIMAHAIDDLLAGKGTIAIMCMCICACSIEQETLTHSIPSCMMWPREAAQ